MKIHQNGDACSSAFRTGTPAALNGGAKLIYENGGGSGVRLGNRQKP